MATGLAVLAVLLALLLLRQRAEWRLVALWAGGALLLLLLWPLGLDWHPLAAIAAAWAALIPARIAQLRAWRLSKPAGAVLLLPILLAFALMILGTMAAGQLLRAD